VPRAAAPSSAMLALHRQCLARSQQEVSQDGPEIGIRTKPWWPRSTRDLPFAIVLTPSVHLERYRKQNQRCSLAGVISSGSSSTGYTCIWSQVALLRRPRPPPGCLLMCSGITCSLATCWTLARLLWCDSPAAVCACFAVRRSSVQSASAGRRPSCTGPWRPLLVVATGTYYAG
jgi:hypothetical protein